MADHYHLLIQTPDGNESRCMRCLKGVYTGDPMTNIGEVFGISSYNTVSSIIERFKPRINAIRKLFKCVEGQNS